MGPGFESLKVHQWPIGQVVKTAASHAVNIGSNPVWVTKILLKGLDNCCNVCYNLQAINDGLKLIHIVGIDCHEGPPVPIPNTEVKLMYADNTWRVTAREDR